MVVDVRQVVSDGMAVRYIELRRLAGVYLAASDKVIYDLCGRQTGWGDDTDTTQARGAQGVD